MSQKTKNPQMCCLGCERDPWAGQGSDAATKPLLSLVSCVHQIRGHLSLINYTLIAPHEQPVLLVCLTAQWQKEIFIFFFFCLSKPRFLLWLLALDCPLHVL